MPDAYSSFIGFIIVTAVFSFFAFKKRNETWKGKLVDKKHKKVYDEDGDYSSDKWVLIFKTNSGKKRRANVKKELFDEVNIGDSFEKKKGSFTPSKE